MTRRLTLGHSPDPDDAFMFYALASGKIETGDLEFTHLLEDIETLNRRALREELDITAISLHAYAAIVEPNESGQAVHLAAAYAKAAGYKLIAEWRYYEITGQLIKSLNDLHTAAFDVELRDGASDTFEKNLAGLKAVLKAVSEAGAQGGAD